jgi:serine/arginine repetitive matrix protein 2
VRRKAQPFAMYNGIGLTTARGSSTSGYVQKNLSFVKPEFFRQKIDQTTSGGRNNRFNNDSFIDKNKTVNKELLEHNRKHAIESKVLELRLSLEDEGVDEDEIERQCQDLREKLSTSLIVSSSRGKKTDSHEITLRKEQELEKLRNAFAVDDDYKPGASFDPEQQEIKKQKRLEEKQKQYEERMKEREEKDRAWKQRKEEEQKRREQREAEWKQREAEREKHREEMEKERDERRKSNPDRSSRDRNRDRPRDNSRSRRNYRDRRSRSHDRNRDRDRSGDRNRKRKSRSPSEDYGRKKRQRGHSAEKDNLVAEKQNNVESTKRRQDEEEAGEVKESVILKESSEQNETETIEPKEKETNVDVTKPPVSRKSRWGIKPVDADITASTDSNQITGNNVESRGGVAESSEQEEISRKVKSRSPSKSPPRGARSRRSRSRSSSSRSSQSTSSTSSSSSSSSSSSRSHSRSRSSSRSVSPSPVRRRTTRSSRK